MKILYITPHLSTGGLPQYLLKKIEYFIKNNEIYLIEWQDITGGVFVVQRNKIIKLLGNNFYSLGGKKHSVIDLINSISPDVIHFEELPETFIAYSTLSEIYDVNRSYNIVCTTHSSFSDPEKLVFTADKFVLVSDWSQNIFKSYFKNIDCEVWEYPVDKKITNKIAAQKQLNFDPEYKHVLNVGLFTRNKNQGELIDLAKKMLRYKIIFHFVGNQAMNFEDYWGPLMKDLPSNCIIHGERNDVDLYYQAADVFYFTSILELNPLVLKEALSYDLPIYIKNLHTYDKTYDSIANFISDDQQINCDNLIKHLNLVKKASSLKIVHNLIDINEDREKKSIESVSKLSEFYEYIQCVNTKYDKDDWNLQAPLEGWMNHGKGHYGCFDSMKKAILNHFSDDIEGLLICESDCIIDVNKQDFKNLLDKAILFADKHKIPYISFSPRFIDGKLLSKNIDEENEFDEFIFTDQIFQTHCFLLTKHYKEYLFEKLNSTWGATDLWLNIIYKNHKMAISRDEITHQEEGVSMIDFCKKGISIETNLSNSKLHLIFSTGRRYEYFEKTFNALFSINPELKNLLAKTWIFDDRSSSEERVKMEKLLKNNLQDNFNSLYLNSNKNLYFIEKFNFIKKVIDKNDCVLFIEDDWVCLDRLNILNHFEKLCSSSWTQIAFADKLSIQEEYIQKNYRINKTYWKNPWPNEYKHINKIVNESYHFCIGKMNNWNNNPSIIKGSVFYNHDFQINKNFEAIFADTTTRNQYFTNELLFEHIGENSLINNI